MKYIEETFSPHDNFTQSHDDFEGMFSIQTVNWSMVILYTIGLVPCAGLGLVCWFERTGQAGPYRTLVNQLVTGCLEQVSTRGASELELELELASIATSNSNSKLAKNFRFSSSSLLNKVTKNADLL